jgi:uncharacterized protein (TIGR01244 family)
MNKLTAIILIALSVGASTTLLADESVANLTADEIRADASRLDNARLISTGQPDEAVLLAAQQAGIVAVIDLRGEEEDRGLDEAVSVEALGMQYVSLPVDGPADVTFDNAAKLDGLLSDIDGPVLLHCASGNRVGALMALRASLHGADAEAALAAGKAAGLTRLEPVVTELLQEK